MRRAGWVGIVAGLPLLCALGGCSAQIAAVNRAFGTEPDGPWMQCAKAGGELSEGQATAATLLGVAAPLAAPDKFQAVQDCRAGRLGK